MNKIKTQELNNTFNATEETSARCRPADMVIVF